MPSPRLCLAAVALAALALFTPSPALAGGQAAPAHGTATHHHPRGLVPRTGHAKPGATSANPDCSACNPPLLFTQGAPVIGGTSSTPGHVTITPIFWAPAGYSFGASYRSVIDGYVQNVAAASGQATNVFSVGTQYYQQMSSGAAIQHIAYSVTAGAEVDAADAFPAQNSGPGCIADVGFTDCVSDAGLQAELRNMLAARHLNVDDSHLYVVMFPAGVETCEGPGAASTTNPCSTNAYCAYHSDAGPPDLIYSNEPYPDLAHCSDPHNGAQAPNGDAEADSQVSLISHEANESITDWSGAWMDSARYENGDECAYVYGTPLGGATGGYYNQIIAGGKYYTQEEFSNEDYALGLGDLTTAGGKLVPGCVQREEPLIVSFTAPSTAMVGTTVSFTATGSADPDSPGAGITYSWNWGDGSAAGTGVSAVHTFNAAGNYTVGLTAMAMDGSSSTTSHSLSVTAPPPTKQRSAVASSSAGPDSPRARVNQASAPASAQARTRMASANAPSAPAFNATSTNPTPTSGAAVPAVPALPFFDLFMRAGRI